MTVHLLNAAVMPAGDGVYRSFVISPEEFAERARVAHNAGHLMSYVGYKQTAELLTELCGFLVPENRKKAILADGDVLLITCLNYVLGERPGKDIDVTLDDMDFRVVYYEHAQTVI